VLDLYVRGRQPAWLPTLEKRRLTILLVFVFAVTAIKVGEDVLGRETGPIDETILVFVHRHVPGALTRFFQVVTLTASSKVLVPLASAAVIALLWARRRLDAVFLAASVIVAATLVYVLKTVVGRDRPALWETHWYWGSSFPSGHTLVVAAFATAAAICVGRIRPAARRRALTIALVWVLLVACSRLVLGVHWPTDVFVAACIGASLPLAISVALDLRRI
jgi:undecaprenyl-diphosphatase